MWVAKGGQYKSRGNVITFSQDIGPLCTSLPRMPKDLDVLVIQKSGARDPGSYKDFRVRKNKVFSFLRYLKTHNRFYADITILPPEEVDLPDDANVLDRLPVVPPRSHPVSPTSPEQDDGLDVDDPETLYTPDELIQEQNMFVPAVIPSRSELEAIRKGMQHAGLAGSDEQPLPWPAFGPPLSEYATEGLWAMAFPTLFPSEAADYLHPRPHRLLLHEWVKHLIRYKDGRFAHHPRFRFFALNMIFRHRAMEQGRFLFHKTIGAADMTIGQLRDNLGRENGAALAAKIVRCVKKVRGTRPYWFTEGAKLKDMIHQIGTPTLFYTLSMADLSWPDLHRLMPDDPFRPGLTPSESYQIRSRNLANNPHIVTAFLMDKHCCLKDTIFQHLDSAGPVKLVDFWYRVEWQARGSGAFFSTASLFL